MRTPFLPPLSEEELRSRPVHELVRDFPELLPALRALAPKLEEAGGRTLGELLEQGNGPAFELGDVLAWRKRSSGGEEPAGKAGGG